MSFFQFTTLFKSLTMMNFNWLGESLRGASIVMVTMMMTISQCTEAGAWPVTGRNVRRGGRQVQVCVMPLVQAGAEGVHSDR